MSWLTLPTYEGITRRILPGPFYLRQTRTSCNIFTFNRFIVTGGKRSGVNRGLQLSLTLLCTIGNSTVRGYNATYDKLRRPAYLAMPSHGALEALRVPWQSQL